MAVNLTYTDDQNSRLDIYLANQMPKYSRSYFTRLIKLGKVSVNDKVAKKSGHELEPGNEIKIQLTEQFYKPVKPKAADFEIIDEQENFMVINKPSGLLVHTTSPTCTEPNLISALLARFDYLHSMPEQYRAGVVHRLDKQTSGVILVAKNIQTQKKLSDLFMQRKVKKNYTALVEGAPEKEGMINSPIGRHPHHRYKRTVGGVRPRSALTFYNVTKYFKDSALVDVEIKTGRTHQIRVHMASINHPLVGDSMYGKESTEIDRTALHASQIEFTLDGKVYRYSAELPKDMSGLDKS